MAAFKSHPLATRFQRLCFCRLTGTTKALVALALCLCAANINASPWIESGKERTRHHLQALADAGLLKSPTTSWPLMWSNVKADLDAIATHELNQAQLWSYHYLKHELRKAMKAVYSEQTLHFGNTVTAIGDFSSDARERYQSSASVTYTGNKVAYKLRGNYVHEPADGHTYRIDGSYFNYLAGNWALGVGEVDRWWGPGWESSLIMSHNARPLPSLYLQRNIATPFELPLLNLLGPWQVTTLMSQLESGRAVPDAKFWGMRVNIKPLNRLEIGLSRTAQWGGKGRPNDIDTFVNLLLGKDNLDDIEGRDRSREPGNQLAGIDWRWGYSAGAISGSIYGQFIGEDEAGGMPSRSIGLAGIELNTLINDIHTRFSLEAQNTTVYFYDSEKRRGNTAYEHSIYQSGYRYYGRAIGASTDNDSESLVLRSQWYLRNGHNVNTSLGRHRLNIDSTDKGESLFAADQQNTYKAQVNYTAPITDSLLLQLSAFHYSDPVVYDGVKLATGGFVSIRAHW